jgi:hypothetical protein
MNPFSIWDKAKRTVFRNAERKQMQMQLQMQMQMQMQNGYPHFGRSGLPLQANSDDISLPLGRRKQPGG